MFELDNKQRKYFGLEPVEDSWEKVQFKGDTYRPDSILYFDGDTIKKHVVSTDTNYKETQYNEQTENRELILPKTKKGKPKKLTASVLESRTGIGVYLSVTSVGDLLIGNYTSRTTFYSRGWEYKQSDSEIESLIEEFIINSPSDHFEQIEEFRQAKRKNIKYKSGDFFAFKLNRTEYGFGRILFDINKARKKKLISENHGLQMIMGPPLIIKLYAFKSDNKKVDIENLKNEKSLPSDIMMDNVIFYGEFEIIGNLPLGITEFEFPISYGMRIDRTPNVFLQWGLIHKELPKKDFNKYIMLENGGLGDHNPYGYYGVGFRPKYDYHDIKETIENNGEYDFSKGEHYKLDTDLRNPQNDIIRQEIFNVFGLDPKKNYEENCKLTGTKDIVELIKEMK
ncbi:immunity 26/phosphotriesterase HocA family protein [Carboxylicivirga marina]|uniref:immunity 26/phosphotriesterase HocA family protein n=1 Tax=Carboxylicivirga marina TaxID=2800988 RepID=UPI002595F607|nr:immunity 26/phosphotriesterase HocA family protein [uncultured Carboxylicivirga sp.]